MTSSNKRPPSAQSIALRALETATDTPRVKICGITNADDARLAIDLGADLLGLNFYAPSPRAIDLRRAQSLRAAVGDDVVLAGVFVNATAAEITAIADAAALDLVQLHGDESPDLVDQLTGSLGRSCLRAFRYRGAETLEQCRSWSTCWGLLFDAPHETLYGGAGRSWAYNALEPVYRNGRVFVAGGIGPDNVERLLTELPEVYGIDVCSGVEATPGRKDPRLLAQLFSRLERARTSPSAGASKTSASSSELGDG